MKHLYLSLFQRMYVSSARQELDGQPSLYSAVLYVSALQFFNLVSIVFVLSATTGYRLPISGWLALTVALALAVLNGLFARYNEAEIRGPHRRTWFAPAYFWASGAIFAVSLVWFTLAAPAFVS